MSVLSVLASDVFHCCDTCDCWLLTFALRGLQVGYGDYTAETDLEKVWSMFAMLFGALVFATITGEISARLTSARGSIQTYNAKMDEMRDFCSSSSLPTHLTRKIEGHYIQMYQDKCIYNDKDILGPLPWTVVRPVLEFLYDDVMRLSLIHI